MDKSLSPTQKAVAKISEIKTTTQVSGNEQSRVMSEKAILAQRYGKTVGSLQEKDIKDEQDKKNFTRFQDTLQKTEEVLTSTFNKLQEQTQSIFDEAISTTNFAQMPKTDVGGSAGVNAFDAVINQSSEFAFALKDLVEQTRQVALVQAERLVAEGKSNEAIQLLANSETQVQRQVKGLEKQAIAQEKAARSAVLFSQATEAAAKSSFTITKLTEYLSSVGQQVDNFSANLERGNSITQQEFASFSLPEIKGLGDITKIVDLKSFQDQVDTIASNFGQFGNDAAAQIKTVAGVFKDSKGLLGRSFAGVGEEAGGEAKKAIEDLLAPLANMGGGVSQLVQRAKDDLLKAASSKSDSASIITQSELENSLSSIKDFTDQYASLFAEFNAKQAALVGQYDNYTKALITNYEKEIGFREKLVDVQSKAADRIAQATGKPLTAAQKDAFRNQARQTRLQGAGIGPEANNVTNLGAGLKYLQNRLRDNAKATEAAKKAQDPKKITALIDEERKLTLMAKETTRALESLADQGEKASEILAGIEKEKAKQKHF